MSLNPTASVRTHAAPILHALVGAAVMLALGTATASAANFAVSGASTTAQTLGSGAGQTGTVNAGSTLTVSGSNVAVTISGNTATLNNLGTISQTGTGRVVRDNTGVTSLVINNGSSTNSSALMQAADADVIQMNKSPASVTLNNYGSLISLNASAGGSQAVDFAAILSGSNVVNNFSGGLLKAFEADSVRTGVGGVVYNAGTILAVSTTGSSSDGIDYQNNSGAQITNDTGGLIEGARHGITGGGVSAASIFTTTITNNVGATIKGDAGSGINLDGFNANLSATIVNHGLIQGNGVTGDGDGIDVDGVVNIINTGTIRSLNSVASSGIAQSEGITVGGGIITNSGLIEGDVASGNLSAVGRGITIAGIDTSGTPEPIYANTVITNQAGGVIRGQSDSAIAVQGAASGFTVTINNNAGGLLQGGGTSNAAVVTSADNDAIENAGTIDGSSSGKAIDMGGGNNSLVILGGAAAVLGDINGGTGSNNSMQIAPGAGNSFDYSGSLSNFYVVRVGSGTATLSGVSTYTGLTLVDSGGKLILDGAMRLSSSSSLQLSGGTLEVANAAGTNAQTFASLSVGHGASMLDLDGSFLSFMALGSLAGDGTLSVLDFYTASAPAYAFRIAGDLSGDLAFLALIARTTINGAAATYSFDGAWTNVTPVPLPGAAVLLLSGLGMLGAARRKRATAPATA